MGGLQPYTTHAVVLGQILAFLRESTGLTQAELAESAGMTQSTWSKIERGMSGLSLEHLHAVAQRLGMPGSELVEQEERCTAALRAEGVAVVERGAEAPGMIEISVNAMASAVAAAQSRAKGEKR